MGQTAITIRIDTSIKRQFDALCQDFGMSANTAFNIFARSVVRNRKIPFEIQADSTDEIIAKAREAISEMRAISTENGNSEMSIDEINAEIHAVRNAM
ncbi:MAG: type II toxin-antitoxin system RelB/DinJ family antitoxin [Candidatus Cryptobacteroides sp.]